MANDIQKQINEYDPSGMSIYGSVVTLSPAAVVSLGSMEGVPAHLPADEAKPPRLALPAPTIGVALAVAVTLAAYLLHGLEVWPFRIAGKQQISATLLAIVLGLGVRNLFTLPAQVSIGTKLLVKRLIPIAIICIGAGLDFTLLRSAGATALGLMAMCVVLGFGLSYGIGRVLGLTGKTAALLGVGTGICGSSAIVAAAPLIDADDEDVVLSVGTVNLLGLIAMLSLPAIAAAVGMGAQAFGVWCGCTIHAVPQVLGAGGAHPADPATALEWATRTQLARVVLLAPLIVILAIAYAKRRSAAGNTGNTAKVHPAKLVPWYIWGFLAAATLSTLGLLPALTFDFSQAANLTTYNLDMRELLTTTGKLLLVIALAGIGLEVRLRKLLSVGSKAIAAGLVSTATLVALAYLLIALAM